MAMDKQMELFETVEGAFDEGGLMQEGGTIDPVSGNDVPVGSTQEEVRDDIPAQLSEGEFVFPADVVRYWGLDTLMKMRQQAKAGLQMMEDMGQMGNSEEAIIPDDIPFDVNDIDMEDDGVLEYSQGGVVNAQAGAFMQPQQQYGISGFQTSQFAGFQPQSITPPMQPVQPTTQQPVQPTGYVTPTQQTTPTSTMQVSGLPGATGSAIDAGPPDEYKTYRNETGQEIQVPFKNGKVHPTFTVPQGYSLVTGAEETKAPETEVETTQVTQEASGQDDEPSFDPVISGEDGKFSTTDMRGVGYDRGSMATAAKEGSVEDQELLDELDLVGKAQFKDVSPVLSAAFGVGFGSAVKEAGTRIAQQTGIGKFKETKGVNPRQEFLTSQKVTMDAMLSGLDSTYGGTRSAFEEGKGTAGQRLHELSPEVKRSLAGELKSNREALSKALEGKTMEDLRAEINNTQEGLGKDLNELGIEKTYTATERGRKVEREKTYGQLFAEARATKSARDKVASQYGIDAKGKSLSQVKQEAKEAQDRIDAAEAKARAYGRSLGGSGDDNDYDTSTYSGSYASGVESYGIAGLAKGGLVDQMEKSGLTPKK